MPWQGNSETIIDRFDVRAHLDYIPEPVHKLASDSTNLLDADVENLGELNYERYRILIQNEFTHTSEEKFLHQIHVEEQFGTSSTKDNKLLKSSIPPKAAIAYTYEDSTPRLPSFSASSYGYGGSKSENNDGEDSEDDVDFDLLLNVNDLNTLQKLELNDSGTKYGLKNIEFLTFLGSDIREKEKLKLMKQQEEEKQHMSGRKARRERRAYKEKQLLRRENWSPPSYATSPFLELESSREIRKSSSDTDSSNPPEKVTYITSFGSKSSETNLPFGPNLPSRYNKKKSFRSKSRSSSSSERNRRRKRRNSPSRRRKRRRSSSSSSSSRSSSTSALRYGNKQSRKQSNSPPTSQPVKRYYGRQQKAESDSSDEDDQFGQNEQKSSNTRSNNQNSGGNCEKITKSTSAKVKDLDEASQSGYSTSKITPKERLKRRMQLALNKQLKADKEAEKIRLEKVEQERLDRQESLREMSIKYRRKERERRHGEQENYSSDDSSRSRKSFHSKSSSSTSSDA